MRKEEEKITLPECASYLVSEKARWIIHRRLDEDKNFSRQYYYSDGKPLVRGTSRYTSPDGGEISLLWIKEKGQFLLTCDDQTNSLIKDILELQAPPKI